MFHGLGGHVVVTAQTAQIVADKECHNNAKVWSPTKLWWDCRILTLRVKTDRELRPLIKVHWVDQYCKIPGSRTRSLSKPTLQSLMGPKRCGDYRGFMAVQGQTKALMTLLFTTTHQCIEVIRG